MPKPRAPLRRTENGCYIRSSKLRVELGELARIFPGAGNADLGG
jgi:hypothetical protein